MRVTKKHVVLGAITIAILSVVIFARTQNNTTNYQSSTQKFKDYTVERGNFKIMVTANGGVIPIDRVEIKSKASGLVEELPVEQGDHIKMGDLIARLDQKDERAAVSQAQADFDIATAELKKSQREFERRNELFAENLVSEEEKDQIELNLAIAKGKLVQATTALDRAKERLSESIVRAPIDGVILQKYVEKGQIIASGISNVSGGTPIVDIADMSSVYIQAGVDEIDIGKIKVGQKANVIADAYPDIIFNGKIVRIAPEAKIEQNVTLFDVIVEVQNREGKLKSGMNTSIEITIIQEDNVLLVPSIAILPAEDSPADKNSGIVMLKRGNRYEPKSVKIGLDNFQEVEILSGLQENDVVGVSMSSRLQEENDQNQARIRNRTSFVSPN